MFIGTLVYMTLLLEKRMSCHDMVNTMRLVLTKMQMLMFLKDCFSSGKDPVIISRNKCPTNADE